MARADGARAWEYREVELPRAMPESTVLTRLSEGWDIVGVHLKAKGRRAPRPVLIMRRRVEVLAEIA